MKITKAILVIGLCGFCFMGCNPGSEQNIPAEPEKVIAEENRQTEEKVAKNITASELPDMTDWSEISRYTGDTDGDGEDENVVLMTSAERDSKGEIIWNDGQNWVLYVEDNGRNFVLIDGYIQSTEVYFEVLDYYKENVTEPKINTIISTGASFVINSYSYDSEKDVYVEENIYDTSEVTESGTNRRFSSFPVIQ